ncbi:C4-dicarboxylate ABC transporter permease [Synergistales bacterium]|nr:C4-dicarboxylate ABC transporter permease [Synergistales bacterium]
MIQAAMIFVLLLFFIFLGFPIYVSTIITAIIFIVAMDIPFILVIIKMFGSIDSFSLMAIPFFIIAGNVMTKSKITDKLVNFANAAVGHMKGGLGHVNILASMLFGGIQGSGAADASAIGGMLIPAMEKQGYDKDYAVAVTAGSSMLSPIIPPSIAMILYSFYTETPVSRLFLGGVIPGVLIGALQMIVNSITYRRRGYTFESGKFSWALLGRTFISSFGALIMPLIIVCGIIFGLVTPTESGVIAIAYGLVYGFFISKELKLKDLPQVLLDSAVTTSVVMMTISAAGVLSNVLVRMRFQNEVLNFAVNTLQNPYLATFFMMIVLLILGCFLDPTVLIAMFATSILSIGNALGFDPIHYGVLMVIIMQVGAITPPVGTFLFISCGIARLPLEQSVGALSPYIFVILLVIIAMIFIPQIVTLLPSLI